MLEEKKKEKKKGVNNWTGEVVSAVTSGQIGVEEGATTSTVPTFIEQHNEWPNKQICLHLASCTILYSSTNTITNSNHQNCFFLPQSLNPHLILSYRAQGRNSTWQSETRRPVRLLIEAWKTTETLKYACIYGVCIMCLSMNKHKYHLDWLPAV